MTDGQLLGAFLGALGGAIAGLLLAVWLVPKLFDWIDRRGKR